jgi:non-specific serine/threonine protein kinase
LLGEYDDFRAHTKSESSPLIDEGAPSKDRIRHILELTDRQKALYKKTVDMVKATIDSAYRDKTSAQAQIIALTAILKLRQICVSPRLVDRSVEELSPKAEFLITKLKELMREGHKALVFSQFTSFLDIVEDDLSKTVNRITGA